MNTCAKCKQEIGSHGYIMFFTHPTQGRFMAQVCDSCHDEIRSKPRGLPAKRTEVPDAFYKAFEQEAQP